MNTTVRLLLAAACVFSLPTRVAAYSYVMPTDEELVSAADGVVVAEVIAPPQQIDGGSMPRLVYPLRVVRDLTGNAPRWLELELPGAIGETWLHIPGVPRLSPGERVLVTYLQGKGGRVGPYQLSLGLFLERETSTGQRAYFRAIGEDGNQRKSRNAEYGAPRDAAAFERWIADRARGVQRAPDYLDRDLRPAAGAKFTLRSFDFTPFGSPAGPARWFEFDTGGTVPWVALSGGQTGTVEDEFLSLQQALAAWTNDVGSKIFLSYGGTVAADTTSLNTVKWDDPDNIIPGPYNCGVGGTLGFGGSSATTPQIESNGTMYYARRDGTVIVNDNAACFFDGNGGKDGAEVLTHEIGHSLAFGHSCGDSQSPSCSDPVLNEATMRALAHGDGRGAVLGIDDQAGAAFVYPSGIVPDPDLLFRNGFE